MKASLKLGKVDTPKVLELAGKATILGVTNENIRATNENTGVITEYDMLVVYNGEQLFLVCMFVV
jgi:hypothetical protein